ncbi:MAG: efflux RND transporter periplasmic adaptor subunit [Acidobacteria bacterium]|nr:efflux RND transporter periplasmic adaptor subunit [Acidobacteriota bacterium]
MRRTNLLAPILGLLLLAIALPLAFTSRSTDAEATAHDAVKRVEVATAESSAVTRALRFSGITRAETRASLSFPMAARLVERPVELGQTVKQGQVLARLDDREMAHAVDSARAAVAEVAARRAQVDQEAARVARLAESGAATPEELEQATAAAAALGAGSDAAAARLRDAQRRLGDAVLRAPFAGIVSEVPVEAGEYVSAGKPVVVISGNGPVEVEIGVPEALVPSLREGDAVEARLPFSSEQRLTGTVRSVSRAAMGSGHLFPVVVSFGDPPGIEPGMTVEVVLESRSDASVTVPLTAILNPGGSQPRLYRLHGTTVELVPVRVEQLTGDRVAVNGSVAAGDEVVISGHGGLLDGETVEVVR